MLESKYLTQDGIVLYFKSMYNLGFNFLFYNPDDGAYTISEKEPNFRDVTFMYCDGRVKHLTGVLAKTVAKELLDGRNYIAFEDYVDCIDWSKVPVDTPILVQDIKGNGYVRRYFAKYKDGKIYAWKDGTTSWTAESNGYITVWNYAKLAK